LHVVNAKERHCQQREHLQMIPSMKRVNTAALPRAYSYIRFSTPQQAKGDSHRRQADKAARYAAEHGLVLDAELNLTDLGVSAYRGKNAKTGALGVFLRAVEDGTVPRGSFLLIENIDRDQTPRCSFFKLSMLAWSLSRSPTENDIRESA
jgi:Resolvase, N terminal domain